MIPLIKHDSTEGEQWDRYNLPRLWMWVSDWLFSNSLSRWASDVCMPTHHLFHVRKTRNVFQKSYHTASGCHWKWRNRKMKVWGRWCFEWALDPKKTCVDLFNQCCMMLSINHLRCHDNQTTKPSWPPISWPPRDSRTCTWFGRPYLQYISWVTPTIFSSFVPSFSHHFPIIFPPFSNHFPIMVPPVSQHVQIIFPSFCHHLFHHFPTSFPPCSRHFATFSPWIHQQKPGDDDLRSGKGPAATTAWWLPSTRRGISQPSGENDGKNHS